MRAEASGGDVRLVFVHVLRLDEAGHAEAGIPAAIRNGLK